MSNKTPPGAPARCFEWIDISGPDERRVERVRRRVGLPAPFVALARARFLYPTVIAVPPGWFLATCFTAPCTRHVFRTHSLYLWFADRVVVTISMKHPMGAMASPLRGTTMARADLVDRVFTELVASHQDVAHELDDVFCASNASRSPHDWHHKERRLITFVNLLERQLTFMKDVGRNVPGVGPADDHLEGLQAIARHASNKVRDLGVCVICARMHAARRRRRRAYADRDH